MANVINATQTGNGGLVSTGDDSGILNIQTNETTAVSIDASQSVDFTNNIDAPNTFGFKNRIINGGMVIDQRNAGASVSNPNAKYITDRFLCQSYRSSSTAQQVADAPATLKYSLKYTNDGTGGAPTAGNTLCFIHAVEGYNVSDLGFGAAGASTITLSFWVKSSVTGTYGVGFGNPSTADGWYGAARSYVATYVINAANTWEYKTITLAGDTSGTWGTTTGVGLSVVFDIGSGANYETTSGSWASGGYNRTSACVKLGSTASATFQVTGVQLEKGTQATSFDFRSIGTELYLCKRYFQLLSSLFGNAGGSTTFYSITQFPVEMRSSPTASLPSALNITYAGVAGWTQSSANIGTATSSSTTGGFFSFANFTGLTTGNPIGFNGNSQYVQLSAEL